MCLTLKKKIDFVVYRKFKLRVLELKQRKKYMLFFKNVMATLVLFFIFFSLIIFFFSIWFFNTVLIEIWDLLICFNLFFICLSEFQENIMALGWCLISWRKKNLLFKKDWNEGTKIKTNIKNKRPCIKKIMSTLFCLFLSLIFIKFSFWSF